MEKYHIIFASDNGYAQHLCVAIYSCIKNFKYPKDLKVIVLDAGISDQNKEKILDSCKKFGSKIDFFKADCSIFNEFTNKNYNKYTYARLLTAEIFPQLDKVLYLDCDIVVNGNLSDLYDTDISNYTAAVIRCEKDLTRKEIQTTYSHIGVDNPYFSAGVMLINLKKRREQHILKKSLDFLKKNKNRILFADQDTLNYLCHDSVLFVHPKYNATNTLLYSNFYQETVFDKKIYEEAKKNTVIYHFAGGSRPWNGECFHTGNNLYWKYLKETLYKGYHIPNKKLFSLNRYKFMFAYYLSLILSQFGYSIYNKSIIIRRKYFL